MIYSLKGDNVIAKLWIPLHEVESSALDQIRDVCNAPGVVDVAVMGDVHTGNGATIGTVIKTADTLFPQAVGVDIGCGMVSVKTSLKYDQVNCDLQDIHDAIRERIPVGFNSNDTIHKDVRSLELWSKFPEIHAPIKDKSMSQIGTLGGGNHFIELSRDQSDNIWIMLHSGSRYIGLQIANYHIKIAQELSGRKNLTYLTKGSLEFDNYLRDLQWAQEYAWQNRNRMMVLIKGYMKHKYPDVEFLPVLLVPRQLFPNHVVRLADAQ